MIMLYLTKEILRFCVNERIIPIIVWCTFCWLLRNKINDIGDEQSLALQPLLG
jgi:hypothetical protein